MPALSGEVDINSVLPLMHIFVCWYIYIYIYIYIYMSVYIYIYTSNDVQTLKASEYCYASDYYYVNFLTVRETEIHMEI